MKVERGMRMDIRLNCPECGELHIDKGVFETKPHHTHACEYCGMVWRPAVECTRGVKFIFKVEEYEGD